MQLNIHFRRLKEMFLYVHNFHRGKAFQEQYNRKISGVLRNFFLWLYSIFFWYSNINNPNLHVHVYGAKHFAQTIKLQQSTILSAHKTSLRRRSSQLVSD